RAVPPGRVATTIRGCTPGGQPRRVPPPWARRTPPLPAPRAAVRPARVVRARRAGSAHWPGAPTRDAWSPAPPRNTLPTARPHTPTPTGCPHVVAVATLRGQWRCSNCRSRPARLPPRAVCGGYWVGRASIRQLGPGCGGNARDVLDVSSAALQDALHIFGLADVLHTVPDHAHESHSECHVWCPIVVDHPVQIRVAERTDVPVGNRVDRVVVVGQQLRRIHPHRGDVGVAVTESYRLDRQIEVESATESLRRPHLFGAGGIGDVVVLHPSEVPDQPRDRVRGIVEPHVEIIHGEPAHG